MPRSTWTTWSSPTDRSTTASPWVPRRGSREPAVVEVPLPRSPNASGSDGRFESGNRPSHRFAHSFDLTVPLRLDLGDHILDQRLRRAEAAAGGDPRSGVDSEGVGAAVAVVGGSRSNSPRAKSRFEGVDLDRSFPSLDHPWHRPYERPCNELQPSRVYQGRRKARRVEPDAEIRPQGVSRHFCSGSGRIFDESGASKRCLDCLGEGSK